MFLKIDHPIINFGLYCSASAKRTDLDLFTPCQILNRAR